VFRLSVALIGAAAGEGVKLLRHQSGDLRPAGLQDENHLAAVDVEQSVTDQRTGGLADAQVRAVAGGSFVVDDPPRNA
jgi:hypothetical protein